MTTHRRLFILAAVAALFLDACATARPFVSDRISVETRGAGSDIILIPGLTGDREIWREVADMLDDRYRLHLVQVNGFAGVPAEANAEGTVAAPVAEEIARYIEEANLRKPAIVGHSLGGTIGLMVAARHPERVGRLMPVDIIPYMGDLFAPAGATAEDLRKIADQTRANILGSPLDQGFLAQMFGTMTLRSEMLPELMRDLRASDPRTVANAFHELLLTDLRPELSRITAPVTVLYALPANLTTTAEQYDASVKRLYANLPNGGVVLIENSRHFIHWDQPQRFVAEVDALMR